MYLHVMVFGPDLGSGTQGSIRGYEFKPDKLNEVILPVWLSDLVVCNQTEIEHPCPSYCHWGFWLFPSFTFSQPCYLFTLHTASKLQSSHHSFSQFFFSDF